LAKCLNQLTDELRKPKYDLKLPSGGNGQSKPDNGANSPAKQAGNEIKGADDYETNNGSGGSAASSQTAAPKPTDDKPSNPEPALTEAQIHTELHRIYLAYLNINRWIGVERNPKDDTSMKTAIEAASLGLSQELHERLSDHGLLKTFSAELVLGFAFTSVGGQIGLAPDVKNVSSEIVDNQAQQPTGYIRWETLHFMAEDQKGFRPDFSFDGSLGFRPALSMIQITDPTQKDAAGNPVVISPLATFQQSFAWDVGVGANFKVNSLSEVTGFARKGQTILTNIETLIGSGKQSTIGTPVANNVGRAEGTVEFGIKGSVFGESLEIRHVDTSVLTPMLRGAVGLRFDSRFKNQGALSSFYRPEWRTFFSFVVDALQVAKRGSTDSPFSVTMQVDYETATFRRSNSPVVPTGTRVFISATTDILKLFQQDKTK
jgi:hypothetical protein